MSRKYKPTDKSKLFEQWLNTVVSDYNGVVTNNHQLNAQCGATNKEKHIRFLNLDAFSTERLWILRYQNFRI